MYKTKQNPDANKHTAIWIWTDILDAYELTELFDSDLLALAPVVEWAN